MKLSKQNRRILIICLSILMGLVLTIYFLLPVLIIQIANSDFVNPELAFFYKYIPKHIMLDIIQQSLSDNQPYKVRCNTLCVIDKYYSTEDLQSIENSIMDCLKSNNHSEKHAAAILYSKHRIIPSKKTLKILWEIFLNEDEDQYTRNLAGLSLLRNYYQNRNESKLLVKTYNKLDPKGKRFGLIVTYTNKENDNESFIKLNGLIYKGE